MERKLAIAAYHMAQLREAPVDPDDRGLPPIPLQAHFEGAGRAIASIPDQLATGIVDILQSTLPRLPPLTSAYLHTVRDRLPNSDLRSRVDEFVSDARYCDLRSWRNRATHRFDRKGPREGVWIVAPTDECGQSVEHRDVVGYLNTMLVYGGWMVTTTSMVEGLTNDLRDRILR